MSGVLVGTSGWSYDHWRGVFFPEDLPRSRWFDYYTSKFASVEVNFSFYRLPSERAITSWRTQAPAGFLFALKGSRLITHQLRLRNCELAVARFYERVSDLGDQLGVILWQLPPDLLRDAPLLGDFLDLLPSRFRAAVEFRDSSWLHSSVYSILQGHRAALVWVSSMSMPPELVETTGFVYARFHGLTGGFAHDYTPTELQPWVAALHDKEGFAFFNNDGEGRAPANATLLADLLNSPRKPTQSEPPTINPTPS